MDEERATTKCMEIGSLGLISSPERQMESRAKNGEASQQVANAVTNRTKWLRRASRPRIKVIGRACHSVIEDWLRCCQQAFWDPLAWVGSPAISMQNWRFSKRSIQSAGWPINGPLERERIKSKYADPTAQLARVLSIWHDQNLLNHVFWPFQLLEPAARPTVADQTWLSGSDSSKGFKTWLMRSHGGYVVRCAVDTFLSSPTINVFPKSVKIDTVSRLGLYHQTLEYNSGSSICKSLTTTLHTPAYLPTLSSSYPIRLNNQSTR